jgi:hypothetical protein
MSFEFVIARERDNVSGWLIEVAIPMERGTSCVAIEVTLMLKVRFILFLSYRQTLANNNKLVIRSDDLLLQITKIWVDISNSLLVFNVWRDVIETDVTLQDIASKILVELLLFASFTIKTIKFVRSGQFSERFFSISVSLLTNACRSIE